VSGWAHGALPRRLRPWLVPGAVAGLALAVGFGVSVALNWSSPSAIEGKYQWFGVLLGAEGLAAGRCWGLLARRGRSRWTAWWVGLVVAVHFVPLAVLGAVQAVTLSALLPRLRRADGPTSATVIPAVFGSAVAFVPSRSRAASAVQRRPESA
jgi:hypothetical protein